MIHSKRIESYEGSLNMSNILGRVFSLGVRICLCLWNSYSGVL